MTGEEPPVDLTEPPHTDADAPPSPWRVHAETKKAIDQQTAESASRSDEELLALCLDWPSFWMRDHEAEEWLAWPLFPAKRQTAIYSKAKAGKSLLLLDVVAAAATGRPILGGPAASPRHILYLDYEMTEDDLAERLEELGYGDHIFSHLHYASLPSLPPLDTAPGGKAVRRLAELLNVEGVFVDTMGRAVTGPEDQADTIRAFYAHTGIYLKADGRACIRADHEGKDPTRGQRGSSGKNDDVDVVWQLTAGDGSIRLKRTHSRVLWVPEHIEARKLADPLRHHVTHQRGFAEGAKDAATNLEHLQVPINATSRQAQQALRDAGQGVRRAVLVDALRWRREEQPQYTTNLTERSREPLKNEEKGTNPGTNHTSPPTPQQNQAGTTPGTNGNHKPGTTPGGSWEPPGGTTPEPFTDEDLFGP